MSWTSACLRQAACFCTQPSLDVCPACVQADHASISTATSAASVPSAPRRHACSSVELVFLADEADSNTSAKLRGLSADCILLHVAGIDVDFILYNLFTFSLILLFCRLEPWHLEML